jgi:transposase-like protein
VYKLEPKPESKRPVRPGVYKCAACRKQFTVTVDERLYYRVPKAAREEGGALWTPRFAE